LRHRAGNKPAKIRVQIDPTDETTNKRKTWKIDRAKEKARVVVVVVDERKRETRLSNKAYFTPASASTTTLSPPHDLNPKLIAILR